MNYYEYMKLGGGAVAMDSQPSSSDFKEDKHPRGQPENAGRFRVSNKTLGKQDDITGVKEGEGEVTLPNGSKIDATYVRLYTDPRGKLHNEKWSEFMYGQTGKGEVSKEMSNILDRLFGGENVPDSEIIATPEWSFAIRKEAELAEEMKRKHGVESTFDIKTRGRDRFREALVEAALSETIGKTVPIKGYDKDFETNEGLKEGESYKVARGRKAFVCIGFPAAGKSTTFANPLAKMHKARLCDSDTVKKALREFSNGFVGNLVHEESTRINEVILDKAMRRGENVVYPILGFKPEKLKRCLEKFHEAGYDVTLCFKDMPESVAKGRLLVRFLQKGRYLPLGCISKAAGGMLVASFDANKGYADAYIRTTNAKPFFGEEKELEAKGITLEALKKGS